MKYCKVEINELGWFNNHFIILSQFLTMHKYIYITISINAKKDKSKSINIAKKWNQWYIKIDSKVLIC